MKELSNHNNYPVPDLANTPTYQAGIIQAKASRLLKKLTDDCLEIHGITSMQWFMVGAIHDAGNNGIRITALSRLLDTTTPYVTNTVNLLELKNIVQRRDSPSGGRAKIVVLHPDFADKFLLIEADVRSEMRKAFYPRIEHRELEIYLKVIHKFSKL